MLEVQANRLRRTIATIQAWSSLNQSKSSEEPRETPQKQAARSLLTDYQHLLSRTERLSSQCQAQLALLMNRAMIVESNKAIGQAQEATKLTRLAFVFVPLSFTASICGMNLAIHRKRTITVGLVRGLHSFPSPVLRRDDV